MTNQLRLSSKADWHGPGEGVWSCPAISPFPIPAVFMGAMFKPRQLFAVSSSVPARKKWLVIGYFLSHVKCFAGEIWYNFYVKIINVLLCCTLIPKSWKALLQLLRKGGAKSPWATPERRGGAPELEAEGKEQPMAFLAWPGLQVSLTNSSSVPLRLTIPANSSQISLGFS